MAKLTRNRVYKWQRAADLRSQGLKLKDIAKELRCSVASVGNMLARAKERAKK